MIAEDVAKGELPLAVVASAGTVNTGAIDPLAGRSPTSARAAGCGFMSTGHTAPPARILVPEHRAELEAIARADSVAMDPHKWLYVPVECGLVLVRDAVAMRDAFSLVPAYLRTDATSGVSAGPWMSEYGFQQTRGFRALKAWMALKRRGVAGYRAAIGHDIELARALADALRMADDFELWEPQGLSIVCFRFVPAPLRGNVEAIDALNQELATRLQLGGRVFLSTTVIRGRFYLRACIVNPRASREDVLSILDAVREAGASLAPR